MLALSEYFIILDLWTAFAEYSFKMQVNIKGFWYKEKMLLFLFWVGSLF